MSLSLSLCLCLCVCLSVCLSLCVLVSVCLSLPCSLFLSKSFLDYALFSVLESTDPQPFPHFIEAFISTNLSFSLVSQKNPQKTTTTKPTQAVPREIWSHRSSSMTPACYTAIWSWVRPKRRGFAALSRACLPSARAARWTWTTPGGCASPMGTTW